MTFSSQVKRELAACLPERGCCRAAEAYGLLEFGHAFSPAGISLQTENGDVAEMYAALTAEVCGVFPRHRENPGKGFHILEVPAPERERVLACFGHGAGEVSVRLNRANLECEQCPACFLRGAFLCCGAVTNPSTGYHLEFSVPYYHLSRDLLALLREVGLDAKWLRRGGGYVIYFKESGQIEDCLTLMGATGAALELMNVKIVKDIRNKANRITNCESANIDKTVAAAAIQMEAVRKIRDTCGLEALPEDLRELASLRLDNPDLSLRELGDALSPPLSRSGVNHRLQRIREFADKL